jgi:hypothetical protein
MMRTWTNMTWPDDPYRTGQQLYRRPAPRLAAFTTWPAVTSGQPARVTVAIVYLPLHRTTTVTVTRQALTFGFRAASTSGTAGMPGVAEMADLDLLQARRHAAILAGYLLAGDVAALQHAHDTGACRGLAAVRGDWAGRRPAAGRAALFDCGLDLPGSPPLEQACQQARIITMGPEGSVGEGWHPAILAVERALAIALLAARHQGHYEWSGTVNTEDIMTAAAWDCLPWPGAASGPRR